jgi:hypothetical protein
MDLKADFRFRAVSGRPPDQPPASNLLGPLAMLKGVWKGRGFNQIWRPFELAKGSDRFLELNETVEQLEFVEIPGDIPNRGLLQPDINVHALRYLQQVQDAHVVDSGGNLAGIHVEPGFWVHVPSTSNPAEPISVARLAAIPHGTTLVAQGVAIPPINAAPPFAPINLGPFPIGAPAPPPQPPPPTPGFPELDLSQPSQFRTSPDDIPNVSQAMVDNPAIVLQMGVQGKNIVSTATLVISTDPTKFLVPSPPMPAGANFPGSGLANISFLQGAAGGPNAQSAMMQAIFWIETIEDSDGRFYMQLQYQQLVILNFNGLSWPHVSVATLIKQGP